ncbi:MAG TPA: GPP34 family phosphoprotein [Arthrobacter sp.]|nr:GPP34 family phosphoprotein [Arthrobacter sp.]
MGERHLGLFKTTRYPEKNHAPEAALLQKIGAALRGSAAGRGTSDGGMSPSGAPDPRTAALVGLLYSEELFGKVSQRMNSG